MSDKVYMVVVTGYDMCSHCGVYKTYEGALKQWNSVRVERLEDYKERDRNDPAKLLGGWDDEIYVYSATTPEQHKKRVEKLGRYSIDIVQIKEYELRE